MFISPTPSTRPSSAGLVESQAVVGDVQTPTTDHVTKPHGHPGCSGVLGGVLDRFHAAEVESSLHQWRRAHPLLSFDGDGDRAGAEPRSQGRDKPVLRQHLGIDPAAQRREGLDGEASRAHLLGQNVARPVGRTAGKDLGEPQVHGQGNEMLLSAIVDVALQSAALCILSLDHTGPASSRARGSAPGARGDAPPTGYAVPPASARAPLGMRDR